MKRLILFFAVLGVAVAALYFSQRRTDHTHVSANALLNMAADAQRDLTRVPMRLTHISDAEEIRIGDALAQRYATQIPKPSAEEQAVEKYVVRVGSTLAVHAHRRLPYRFHLLADRASFNAFSLPGGHVYIGRGFVDQMTTEDELASILGHEIEHIDHYHCAERVQVEAKLKKLNLEAVGALLQIPLELWEAGYQKDEEMEADREGMYLAVASGYSPYGAVGVFQRLAKLEQEYVIQAESPEQELSELAIQSLLGYFRSHPQPSERLAQANNLIAHERWEERKAQRPFRVEYEVHNGEFVK
jgi:beta-barrel assembly-enhancing protease